MEKIEVSFKFDKNNWYFNEDMHIYNIVSLNSIYVGHLESKERLRIQPAQLFNFS